MKDVKINNYDVNWVHGVYNLQEYFGAVNMLLTDNAHMALS